MDYFYVFQYELSSTLINGQYNPLRYLKYTKINVNLFQQQQFKKEGNVMIFQRLDQDITEQKILFKKMIQNIVRQISDSMVNFINVSVVCQTLRLFTEVIPRECKRRDLQVPYALMNYFDLKQHLRSQCYCPYKKWSDIAQYMQICTAKETELRSSTEIIQKILKILHKDNKLTSVSQRYVKKCQKINNQLNVENQTRFKYYKILGLPFRTFPSQILQILAHQVPQNKRQIIFIYERQRFSGRAMLKIPEDYQKQLIAKNRMYIGTRYIQMEISSQYEYEKTKMKQENRNNDRSLSRFKEEPKRQYNRHKNDYSPQYRSRSRQKSLVKHESQSYENKRQNRQVKRQENPFQHDFNLNNGQYGLKLRGLPFSFSQWDVENMFNFYNVIGGSVKLGIKPGTKSLKNGQAVLLMRSYSDAQKALDMNGFRCMGRYLEVRVIGKDQYVRYK